MKNIYLSLVLSLGICSGLFAQKTEQRIFSPQIEPDPSNLLALPKKQTKVLTKATGTIHYSEDFSGGGPMANQLPSGWTRQNLAGNNNNWIWSNSPPGGQYSTNIPVLNSITASNGFISLPSDFYNTPTPRGGFVNMYASITSPKINLDSSVGNYTIKWIQSLRYCCNPNGNLLLEVSTDSVNWTSFDATKGRSVGLASANGEHMSINVSRELGFSSTAYIRFTKSVVSHYYWMIDDLKIVEEANNTFGINNFQILFEDTFPQNTNYTQVPLVIMPRISVNGQFTNLSLYDQNNLRAKAELYRHSNINTSKHLLDSSSVLGNSVLPRFASFNPTVRYLNARQNGKMSLEFYSTSDSIAPVNAKRVTYHFEVSDTVIAKDYGAFNTLTSVASFQSGGNNGDQWGTLVSVGNVGATIKSISVYVANDSNVIGSSIRAVLHEVSHAPFSSLNLILSGQEVKTITASDTGKWVTIPYNSGAGFGPQHILHSGKQYVVGWEQVGGASSGNYFATGRDTSAEKYAPPLSNLIYTSSNQNWTWVTHVAGLRANIYPQTTVSINEAKEEQSSLVVYPNPTNGFLQIRNLPVGAHTLQIRNVSGQLVHQEVITPGQELMQLDLNQLHKAIYFLVVRGSTTQQVEKVLLN